MQKRKPAQNLLSNNDLKTHLHRDLASTDKLVVILASFDAPSQIRDIKRRGNEAGFRIPRGWNVSSLLSRSNGLAIRITSGWEITASGRQHLRRLGIGENSPVIQTATDLRAELCNIKEPHIRAFAEEAVECHEYGLHRSAIVMSWIAAMGVLHSFVYSHHLQQFNAEAQRVNQRWKNARTPDELGNMRESEFLDRLVGISMISKNVKTELRRCLDLRNGCGHPTSLNIRANASANHLEILMLNVFQKFQ